MSKDVPLPPHNGDEDIGGEMEGWLTIDVHQTPTDIVVESAVAGVTPEDLDVVVTPDSLTIKGKRAHETREEKRDYLYQECYWGKFSRSIILPQEIDPEGASVTLRNGILTVKLPKSEKQKAKKLKIKIES